MTYRFTTSLPYLLNRLGVRFGELFAIRLQDYELTLPMYRVMAVLHQEGKQSLGDLSVMCSIELSTLSRLIGTLTKRELVSRVRVEDNARMVHIDLTLKGQSLIQELLPIAAEFEQISTASFSEDEMLWLKKALIQMSEDLEKLSAN